MKSILLLVLATAIWGLGFAGTRWTLTDYSPIWSNSLRFIFAGVISFIILCFSKYKFKEINHKSALLCSFLLFAGLATQTIGIAHTSLAKSGFLTTLYAIFTPLILTLRGYKLENRYWFSLFIAMIGISLICELNIDNFNLGDVFITISALFFSGHILAIDKLAKSQPAINFNLWQCVYIGIIGFVFGAVYEGIPPLYPAINIENGFLFSPFFGFIVLAVFSSIIAFSIQVIVQEKVAPHIVSVIFLMESVFASIFGYIFFKETLSLMALTGCIFILLSVYLISNNSSRKS